MKKLSSKELDSLGIKKYVSPPNLSFVGGIIVKSDTSFEDLTEVDDSDQENGIYKVKRIEQTLKDCILTTITTEEFKYNGFHTKVSQTMTEEYPKDKEILLIYKNGSGWAMAEARLMTVADALKGMELLKDKEE